MMEPSCNNDHTLTGDLCGSPLGHTGPCIRRSNLEAQKAREAQPLPKSARHPDGITDRDRVDSLLVGLTVPNIIRGALAHALGVARDEGRAEQRALPMPSLGNPLGVRVKQAKCVRCGYPAGPLGNSYELCPTCVAEDEGSIPAAEPEDSTPSSGLAPCAHEDSRLVGIGGAWCKRCGALGYLSEDRTSRVWEMPFTSQASEVSCRCGLYVGACPLHDHDYRTDAENAIEADRAARAKGPAK